MFDEFDDIMPEMRQLKEENEQLRKDIFHREGLNDAWALEVDNLKWEIRNLQKECSRLRRLIGPSEMIESDYLDDIK